MNKIVSLFKLVWYTILRVSDHTWRYFLGLPLLRHSEITPHLYLGGQYNIRGLKTLKKIGITSIVNMRETSVRNLKGIQHFDVLELPTKDMHAPSMTNLKKGIDFIKNNVGNEGKVYIHCRLGEGRGPSMLTAYLISTGMLLEDAIKLIRQVRPFIDITPSQYRQLKKLENELVKT